MCFRTRLVWMWVEMEKELSFSADRSDRTEISGKMLLENQYQSEETILSVLNFKTLISLSFPFESGSKNFTLWCSQYETFLLLMGFMFKNILKLEPNEKSNSKCSDSFLYKKLSERCQLFWSESGVAWLELILMSPELSWKWSRLKVVWENGGWKVPFFFSFSSIEVDFSGMVEGWRIQTLVMEMERARSRTRQWKMLSMDTDEEEVLDWCIWQRQKPKDASMWRNHSSWIPSILSYSLEKLSNICLKFDWLKGRCWILISTGVCFVPRDRICAIKIPLKSFEYFMKYLIDLVFNWKGQIKISN